MKKFTKYFIQELIWPFFIGLGFFTFIFILSPIVQLVDMLIVKCVPFKEVMLLFLYLLPSTIAISLPMATLVAVLMAYGRISSDSEVVAMRSSGISYLRIFYPAILLSIMISFVGIFFNNTPLPRGNYAFQKLYREIVQRKPTTQLNEHTITRVTSGKFTRYVGIDRIDGKTAIMHGVIIYERDGTTGEVKNITAQRGKWIKPVEKETPDEKIILIMRLQLENGNIQQPKKDNLDQFHNIPFKKLVVNFPQQIAYSINVNKGTRDKTASEILIDIKKRMKQGGKRPHRLWVEYYKRFSIPFAALGFVLIGLPFSIVSGRSGKGISLGISFIIIFAYYLLYTFGETMGRKGEINEFLAVWIPNIIFMLLGTIYIYKISKT